MTKSVEVASAASRVEDAIAATAVVDVWTAATAATDDVVGTSLVEGSIVTVVAQLEVQADEKVVAATSVGEATATTELECSG